MDFYDQPEDPGVPAVIAALVAAGLVALLAVILIAGSGGSTEASQQAGEPALPQAERYPQVSDKFASSVRIQTNDAQSAHLGFCQGEGLVDAAVAAQADIPRGYCEPIADVAGDRDDGPRFPSGDGPADPANGY